VGSTTRNSYESNGGVNWIAIAARQGGIGDTTGPANSDLGQACQAQ
jgi:hypothetical protein